MELQDSGFSCWLQCGRAVALCRSINILTEEEQKPQHGLEFGSIAWRGTPPNTVRVALSYRQSLSRSRLLLKADRSVQLQKAQEQRPAVDS